MMLSILLNIFACATASHSVRNQTSVWSQDRWIQKFEADGDKRDDEAALQGRGCGIRGFVGQLCGGKKTCT